MAINKYDKAMGIKASDKNKCSFTLNLNDDVDSYMSIENFRITEGFKTKQAFLDACVLFYMKNHNSKELPTGLSYEEEDIFGEELIQCRCCGKYLPKSMFYKHGKSFDNKKNMCSHKKKETE